MLRRIALVGALAATILIPGEVLAWGRGGGFGGGGHFGGWGGGWGGYGWRRPGWGNGGWAYRPYYYRSGFYGGYGSGCYRPVWTGWGRTWVNVCGYPGWGYGGWGW